MLCYQCTPSWRAGTLTYRYINLLDKYEPPSCEQLRDIPEYVQEGDLFMLTDFKSGFHHQLKCAL